MKALMEHSYLGDQMKELGHPQDDVEQASSDSD